MSAKDLRTLIEASPFKPFGIVTKDDVLLHVSSKALARMEPDGSVEVWSDDKVCLGRVSEADVKEILIDPTPSAHALEQLQLLRQYRHTRPFVPFEVLVKDGRRFLIDHPYYVAIPPGDRTISVSKDPVGHARIPVADIIEVRRG
jgi:hypothetical protein